MLFSLKPDNKKTTKIYRSIYISESLVEKVEQLANENDTSFNNMVISIIENFLSGDENSA